MNLFSMFLMYIQGLYQLLLSIFSDFYLKSVLMTSCSTSCFIKSETNCKLGYITIQLMLIVISSSPLQYMSVSTEMCNG